MVGAIALLPQVRFDYNLLNMQDQKGEAVQAFRKLLADTEHSPWHAVVLANDHKETERLASRLAELPHSKPIVEHKDARSEAMSRYGLNERQSTKDLIQ